MKRINIALRIFKQKYYIESRLRLEVIIVLCLVAAFVCTVTGRHRKKLSILMQAHRSTRFLKLKKIISLNYIKPNLALCDISTPLTEREKKKLDSWLDSRFIILKASTEKEKGVLLVKFTPVIEVLVRAFNMPELLKKYQLVLEPSWTGYCQPEILQFAKFSEDVFVLAAEESDFEFINSLDSNLLALSLGPSDWVHADGQDKFLGCEKKYDLVMNSNWGGWKRHYVLFEALRELPISLKVALIGFPWEGETLQDVKDLAGYYGVENQITFFERLDYCDVMNVVAESKVGLLLSLKEGSNKAVSEYIFCDIPVILQDLHVGGARGKIVSATGQFSSDRELPVAIATMLESCKELQVRQWGLNNISSHISTQKLNNILRKASEKRGGIWSRDIVEKINSPELQYAEPKNKLRFEEERSRLKELLL